MNDEPASPPPRVTVLKGDVRPESGGARLAGNGRGLMVGVLATLAIVLIASVVLIAMAMDRGVDSARREIARREAADRVRQRQAVESAAAEDRARAANLPVLSDPASWITSEDYPMDSLRRGEEGTVTIAWVADTNGRIGDCKTVTSSGHSSLDRAACTAIVRRGRYAAVPANIGPRTFTRRVVWKIPG